MATNNDRLRARYGICLSDSCQKCKDKTVQVITGRKDFVCEECGKPLREVPRPRTTWEKHGKKVIGGIVALVIIGGAAGSYQYFKNSEPDVTKTDTIRFDSFTKDGDIVDSIQTTTVQKDTAKVNTVSEPAKEENVTEEKADKPTSTKKEPAATSRPDNGKVRLGYGTYQGETKNGKPHGHGTITYTSPHRIVASKDFVAQPGDKFEGEFRNGNVSGGIGYWYHDGDITAVKP